MSKTQQIEELCNVVRDLVERDDGQINDPRILFALSPEDIARYHRNGRFDKLLEYENASANSVFAG